MIIADVGIVTDLAQDGDALLADLRPAKFGIRAPVLWSLDWPEFDAHLCPRLRLYRRVDGITGEGRVARSPYGRTHDCVT